MTLLFRNEYDKMKPDATAAAAADLRTEIERQKRVPEATAGQTLAGEIHNR